MRTRLRLCILSACLAMSACATTPGTAELAGSTWRLASFQSSDDGIAALRSSDPQRYTLSFGNDGRLAAKLDCNRGTGPWQAEAGDAKGGSLRLGPLGTTRAMCPPDPLGANLVRDLEAVRSYRVERARLYLSLPADAGVYVWERVTP